jgi:hypothetical protein
MLLLYDAPSHLVGARSLRRFDRSISGDSQVGDRQIVASPSPLRPLPTLLNNQWLFRRGNKWLLLYM